MDEDASPQGNPSFSVTVFGATGLVGGLLVQVLSQYPQIQTIHCPLRREPTPALQKIPQCKFHQADLSQLDGEEEFFFVDKIFCCLGTTMKQAGSREAFEKVDLEIPLNLALFSKRAGVDSFAIISSIGASECSCFFYLSTKGRLETGIGHLAFPRYLVVRPSLLQGSRAQLRLGEWMLQKMLGFCAPVLPAAIRPITALQVAQVLAGLVMTMGTGHRVLKNAALHSYSQRFANLH